MLILYHLGAVFIMPNSSSLLGRELAGYFLDYANLMGFNTTWQFFSPGPSPTYYLEYQVETPSDPDMLQAPTLQYPPKRKPFTWSDFYNRRLFGMRFFTLFPERLERFFVPFLCRQHPGATGVYVQSVFERIPNIERAEANARFKDMSERLDLPRRRYGCPEPELNVDPAQDPALHDADDGAAFDAEKGEASP